MPKRSHASKQTYARSSAWTLMLTISIPTGTLLGVLVGLLI